MATRVSTRQKYAEKLLEAAQAKANSATLVLVPWILALVAFWSASFEPLIPILRTAQVNDNSVKSSHEVEADYREKLNNKLLPATSYDVVKAILEDQKSISDQRKAALKELKDKIRIKFTLPSLPAFEVRPQYAGFVWSLFLMLSLIWLWNKRQFVIRSLEQGSSLLWTSSAPDRPIRDPALVLQMPWWIAPRAEKYSEERHKHVANFLYGWNHSSRWHGWLTACVFLMLLLVSCRVGLVGVSSAILLMPEQAGWVSALTVACLVVSAFIMVTWFFPTSAGASSVPDARRRRLLSMAGLGLLGLPVLSYLSAKKPALRTWLDWVKTPRFRKPKAAVWTAPGLGFYLNQKSGVFHYGREYMGEKTSGIAFHDVLNSSHDSPKTANFISCAPEKALTELKLTPRCIGLVRNFASDLCSQRASVHSQEVTKACEHLEAFLTRGIKEKPNAAGLVNLAYDLASLYSLASNTAGIDRTTQLLKQLSDSDKAKTAVEKIGNPKSRWRESTKGRPSNGV